MNCFKNIVQKNILPLLVLVAILSNSSCKKFLAANPKDVVLEANFPKNYWDAESLLRGAYQALQPLTEYKFVLGEVPGDWTTPGSGADSNIVQLAYHRATDQNKYTNWQPYYDLINRANYIIKTIPSVPLDSNYFSASQRDQYIGEARFLRSWAYFHLVENFGPVPLVWSAVDDISKVDVLFTIPPSPENVVLDSVEADLQRAYNVTSNQILVLNSFDAGLRVSVEQSALRIKRQAVCGLQAEVYLWRNKYAQAITACRNFDFTENSTASSGAYNILNSGASWMSIFTTTPSAGLYGESIFRVNFSFAARETNTLMMLTSNDAGSGGRYMVAPSTNAIKTYNPYYPDSLSTSNLKNELYRGFGNSYAGSAPFYNRLKSSPVIWKFIGLASVAAASVDVPATTRAPYQSDYCPHIYRYADVLLLWAEASNRIGDKATAISKVNAMRSWAGMPAPTTALQYGDSITVNSTTQKIENYILRERGLELGFEGRRWYDLMRMARHQGTPDFPNVSTVINAIKLRVPAALWPDDSTRLSDTKNWYLPYNANEKRLNPSLIK